MKKVLLIFLLALAIGQAENAMAATVEVIPTLTNSHGGTASGQDLKVCITMSNFKDCSVDMPTFTLPSAGDYSVQFLPPAGYSYEANYNCSNGTHFDFGQQKDVCNGEPDRTITCSGSIGTDEDKKCYVTYTDGAPIIVTPPPTPPQPTPIIPQTNPPTTTGTTIIQYVPVAATTTPEVQTIIQHTIEIQTQIRTATNTIVVAATSSDATTTKQIADLQKRVGWLEQIVNSIVEFLQKIFGF